MSQKYFGLRSNQVWDSLPLILRQIFMSPRWRLSHPSLMFCSCAFAGSISNSLEFTFKIYLNLSPLQCLVCLPASPPPFLSVFPQCNLVFPYVQVMKWAVWTKSLKPIQRALLMASPANTLFKNPSSHPSLECMIPFQPFWNQGWMTYPDFFLLNSFSVAFISILL